MHTNIDEKFKDASPKETVLKIQSILKDFGVSVSEKWNESGVSGCYSLRIVVDGTGFGTNGKGITKELARASGYAELMERLQSGSFSKTFGESRLFFNDLKNMNKEELSDSGKDYFEELAKAFSLMSNDEITADSIVDQAYVLENTSELIKTIPYYDVCNGKYVYLPIKFVKGLYSSNGLAAGNSSAEAIVQAFSEIMERYCRKEVITKNLTPPTIPDEYLAKHKTAYSIITEIRENGYEILVKDCSLGNGYPVIASALIDKEKHTYLVNVAASPVFEIAVERTLTELLQGSHIDSTATMKDVICDKSSSLNIKTLYRSFRDGHSQYPLEFFDDVESYSFTEFEDLSSYSNLDLLSWIVAFVKKMEWRMLVRDLSHLGFNTFRVIVPGVSEAYFDRYINKTPISGMLNSIKDARRDFTNATFDELLMAKMAFSSIVSYGGNDVKCSNFTGIHYANDKEDRFLGYMVLAYIEWELGNYVGAYKCVWSSLDLAGEYNDYLTCFERLNRYTKAGYTFDVSLNVLSKFYPSDVIEEVKSVFTTKSNPFSRFVNPCNSDNCDCCKIADKCLNRIRNKITDRLNTYIESFDNHKAFSEIEELFGKL